MIRVVVQETRDCQLGDLVFHAEPRVLVKSATHELLYVPGGSGYTVDHKIGYCPPCVLLVNLAEMDAGDPKGTGYEYLSRGEKLTAEHLRSLLGPIVRVFKYARLVAVMSPDVTVEIA